MLTAVFSMTGEIYINSTLAYCSKCNKTEQARIISRDNKVYLERMCPVHGVYSSIIASDYHWYRDRIKSFGEVTVPHHTKPAKNACPLDCGVCEWHSNKLTLPVFSITNDCNLDCPKCFTFNRPDAKYYKSLEETEQILDHIAAQSGGVQLINLTGGEPTLHPEIIDILNLCNQKGIGRVTMNTNGIKIAASREFAAALKETGVQVVLSLDTLDPEMSKIIYGRDISKEKRQTLELLEEFDIPTTILSVAIKHHNEKEIQEIAARYLKKEFVRSMTIQNMTFTGLNGSKFEPREHITMDEVENLLAKNTEFNQTDFFNFASYHPMCYSIAYYFSKDGIIVPLTKLLDKESLSKMTKDSYLIDPKQDFSREFLNGVNEMWANGEDENTIRVLKDMINKLYPNDREISGEERQNYFERYFKMIYIHPHMDEDNFDIDRVSKCGDLVPDEQGNMIPACAYNLLYRQKDSRFWVEQ